MSNIAVDQDSWWRDAKLNTLAVVGLLLPLSSCDQEAHQAASTRVGPEISKQIADWVSATSAIEKKAGVSTDAGWVLGSAQRASGKSVDEVTSIFNKFYKGTRFDAYTAASMTYESLLNPRVPTPDAMLEKANAFVAKSSVDSYSAFTLALASFKSGKSVDEVYDYYQLIVHAPNFSCDFSSAAAMTLEFVPFNYQFDSGTQR